MGFKGWAAVSSTTSRAAQIGSRLVVFTLFLQGPALAFSQAAHDSLQTVKHSTAFTFIKKDGTCVDGPISRIGARTVTILPPGTPPVTIARDDLRQVRQGDSLLFSTRSSWADVEAVHLLPREAFQIKLRKGKHVDGRLLRVEPDGMLFKHFLWRTKLIPKSDIVTVDYLRVKPNSDAFDYFTQEAPGLLFFYPEFYDRLKGLEGRVPVRLYDSVQPEDDAPLQCSRR